jgi:acetyl-CoA acyltransferase
VGKAKRGSLATVRPDELAAAVIQDLLKRAPALDPADVDDVVLGCAFPEGEQGMNMARMVALRAGLPYTVPAETINRFCTSGMQSIAHVAYAIMAGQIQIAIAGGVESMTMVPMTGYKFSPLPYLAENMPQAFTNMGLTAENVAAKYGVSRLDQDAFALRSHQLAVAAQVAGRFAGQIVPVSVPGRRGQATLVDTDEGPRADTSLEVLAGLRPAFRAGGTVTAGTSSATTS